MTKILHKLKCSMPECTNHVNYHKKFKNGQYQWKQCCEFHRGDGKYQVNAYKTGIGCQTDNCKCNITNPVALSFDHQE